MKQLFLFLGILLVQQASTPTAKEIIEKAEEKVRGTESAYSEMTVSTVRPKWTRDMTMKSWAKGQDYSMVLVTSPAREKGTFFLKREKEVWNYVPSIERSIKMPPSMMMQSWMGTDFTNDDLVRESSTINDYTHKILGDSTIEARKCYKIELLPKPDAPVVWGKLIIFVDETDYIQLRTEMYDEDGYLVNVLNSSNIKKMGGKIIATKMEMMPLEKEGHKTIMVINKIEFDQTIEEDFFTPQNMKRVK